MYGIIYKVTNKINDRIYIGQTIRTLDKRINCHIGEVNRKRKNTVFYKAIRKYGKENFEWSIVEECDTREELDEMEFHYIKQYNSHVRNGYNMTWGGDGGDTWSGKHHSEESKEKMRKAAKDRIFTDEHKKNISVANYKRFENKENHPMFGKHHSEESKQKSRMSHLGKPHYKLRKNYIVITPEGEEILVNGIVEFCKYWKKEKLHPISLSKCAQGKQKQSKGYRCYYV